MIATGWAVTLAAALMVAGLAMATQVSWVSRLQTRVSLGATELSAGSVLELRIYEAGRAVRRVPLTHGEAWPRDATRVIPILLAEPLDPRSVARFSVYYRAASPLTPPLSIVAADVELLPAHQPAQRLLNATLAGVIMREGEVASEDRDPRALRCSTDADCDDHRQCDGRERCAPADSGADARGCVKGMPLVCPVNEVCAEQRGCLGIGAAPQ